jgi:hypothetical protein
LNQRGHGGTVVAGQVTLEFTEKRRDRTVIEERSLHCHGDGEDGDQPGMRVV